MPDPLIHIASLIRRPVIAAIRSYFIGRRVHRFVVADGQEVYMNEGTIRGVIVDRGEGDSVSNIFLVWMPSNLGSLTDTIRVPVTDLRVHRTLKEWCFYD